ncbi:hypothetical protein HPB52_020333 [Rhipicephalus sanguineus]|uniref:Uncharacterized protein n=1 Tax=Rhipicephalus sanguineus TaxID=34632 RepID=A0A9D4QFH4_RHISA|nr:hypothetical protein HPB52_020333 [Rhipicephalus sanguineus]
METTSSDQAMPSENVYLADMVKLWERKQSQAAAPPKGKGRAPSHSKRRLPPARPRAPLQTVGALQLPPRQFEKPSGDPAPRLSRDRSAEASRSSRAQIRTPVRSYRRRDSYIPERILA